MTRWPTSAKLLLIISIALLPLALIATAATVRITQIADDEARSRLRMTAVETARALATELRGDVAALDVASRALARDALDAPSCARVEGIFAPQMARGTRFLIADRTGRRLCGETFPGARAALAAQSAPDTTATIVPGQGLVLRLGEADAGVETVAFFSRDLLATLGPPVDTPLPFAATLLTNDDALVLRQMPRLALLERRERQTVPLSFAGLSLAVEVRSAPITSPLVIALLLPLLMWLAAAAIAWLVVDRLLVRPLRDLRASLAAFRPGTEPDALALNALPAQEIRDLGDTFRTLTQTVAVHEAGLAEGLMRQTKLTREVHHRVKNNLQVIASLINIHARGAEHPEAVQAYASIQRRVDALAVVHRHHYAEMEENRGLSLRSVIGELCSNIRATAPPGSRVGITIDIDPCYVSQDVAVALAFLLTELIELAMTCDPTAKIAIVLRSHDRAAPSGRGELSVTSPALRESEAWREGLEKRFGRVIEGLARQLRAPLRHQAATGRYAIDVAILGCD